MMTSGSADSNQDRSIHPPERGSVRVAVLASIPRLLEQYAELPARRILAEVGLRPSLFENPENCIGFNEVGLLLGHCARHSGMPHFGLLVGQQVDLETLGEYGQLGVYGPDVGTALGAMIRHICSNDRGGVPSLLTQNGVTELGYAVYVPIEHGAVHIYDVTLAIIYKLLRGMCGSTFRPLEVRFTHSAPADSRPYQALFQAPLAFDADRDAIIFDSKWLSVALPGRDDERFACLEDRLTILESELNIDLLEQLRSVLRPLVVSQCSSLTDEVCRMLRRHPRTLNRQLQARGTTLRDLVGEVRYDLAREMLADSDMSLIGISNLLGYADASIFTRAFRRWSGVAPSAWREQHH